MDSPGPAGRLIAVGSSRRDQELQRTEDTDLRQAQTGCGEAVLQLFRPRGTGVIDHVAHRELPGPSRRRDESGAGVERWIGGGRKNGLRSLFKRFTSDVCKRLLWNMAR